jgi:hypothetical protein
MGATEQTPCRSRSYQGTADTVMFVDEVARQAHTIARDVPVAPLDLLAGPDPALRIDALHAGYGQIWVLHSSNLRGRPRPVTVQ